MDSVIERLRDSWMFAVGLFGEDAIPFIIGCMCYAVIFMIAAFLFGKDEDG